MLDIYLDAIKRFDGDYGRYYGRDDVILTRFWVLVNFIIGLLHI